MQGDDDKAARAEARQICAWAEVSTIRDRAQLIQRACMRSVPCPTLDIPLSELSIDLVERVKQLELIALSNRKGRWDAQESLRDVLDIIVAG